MRHTAEVEIVENPDAYFRDDRKYGTLRVIMDDEDRHYIEVQLQWHERGWDQEFKVHKDEFAKLVKLMEEA